MGALQEIRLIVEAENNGSGNITGFSYQRELPQGLSMVWEACDGGEVQVGDGVKWNISDLAPGEKKSMVISFTVVPSSSLNFTGASINFTYLRPILDVEPTFSGYTNTTFTISHSYQGHGTWYVEANVPDESEFDMRLDSVKLYRSHVDDPFNTLEIASYTPNVTLTTGQSWKTSMMDNFSLMPAYFIKLNYTLPYSIERKSIFSASTEPFSVALSAPSPTKNTGHYVYTYIYPYLQPPAGTVTPTPLPTRYPDIMFITPTMGSVIRDNETTIKVSLLPTGPGRVVFYGSTDNLTWERIGESEVIGNISEILWKVPQISNRYYIKAEHYDSLGLRDVEYLEVVLAHETQPVDLLTTLVSRVDWPSIFIFIILLLLMPPLIFTLLPHKAIIYDSSYLLWLSKSKDWQSKLPHNVVRPESLGEEMRFAEGVRGMSVRDMKEAARLKNEYTINSYDAMALQLAKEKGLILYTMNERLYEIAKSLRIKAKLIKK